MTQHFCRQSGCEVSTSGKCLEGFDPPTKCPFRSEQLQEPEQLVAYSEQDLIDLPSGDALTERQASEVTRCGPTKLVIIAGPYGSGKTTILTSLFESFQEAPFGNFLFRGSRTIVGFERRCHLGRKESGQATADTAHTSVREGIVFLHLDLAHKDAGLLVSANLLLSDISGEQFRRLRDSSAAVKEMAVLERTDHLCVVVDGEKILNPEMRHAARNDSRSMLRGIVESGQLYRRCVIDILITKWDRIVEAVSRSDSEDIKFYVNETVRQLRATAKAHEVRVHEIAARPPVDARVPFAHGLPTLLRSWMSDSDESEGPLRMYICTRPRREFDRFTESVLVRQGLESNYDIADV